jgi:hypothetical protein
VRVGDLLSWWDVAGHSGQCGLCYGKPGWNRDWTVSTVAIRIGRLGPMAGPTAWDDIRASFDRHRDELAVTCPDAVEEIGLIQP